MNPQAKLLIETLKNRGWHITTAESCTAGMVAAAIVDIPGASAVFEEGYITYSDRIKQKILGVSKETLAANTAVSAKTAEEMAIGAAKASGSQLTIAVTGYAGPDNASDGTPAGTVYIGIWCQGQVFSQNYLFHGERSIVRQKAAEAAICQALQTLTV